MSRLTSRAYRSPLVLALAALGACADETTAPTSLSSLRPDAAVEEPNVVSNTNDAGIGSLRWVLSWTVGGETIRFAPALAGQTIALDSVLYITKAVTIEGPADRGVTIDGQDKTRLIKINAPVTLTLRNLSLTGGNSGGSVGSVVNSGDFAGDRRVVLEHSTVHGNKAGGAVAITGNHVSLINSTVSGTAFSAGGKANFPAVMGDTVTLVNSTVAHNANSGVGSGTPVGRLILRNSIVANNDSTSCPMPAATITREGRNLSDDDSCGGPAQIMIGDPEIGPLANNGGPTKTHALLAGSPAINAGAACDVTVDQRYVARDAQCDLGAFEFTDFTQVTVTVDQNVSVNRSTGWAVVTGTVQCSRAETFALAVQLAQQQRSGRTTRTVDAASTVPVECSTTPRPWTTSMVPTSGAFENGSATASAQTVDAEPWVTAASVSTPVRLNWSRR